MIFKEFDEEHEMETQISEEVGKELKTYFFQIVISIQSKLEHAVYFVSALIITILFTYILAQVLLFIAGKVIDFTEPPPEPPKICHEITVIKYRDDSEENRPAPRKRKLASKRNLESSSVHT